MEWQLILALVLAIPIILFPVAFIWYLNVGGIYAAIKEARKRRAAREGKIRAIADVEQHVTAVATKEQPVEKELIGTKH